MKYTSGYGKDEVVAYVDGEPIHVEDYLYWLAYTAEQYHGFMFGEEEPDWNWTTSDSGVLLGDFVKEQALDSAKLYRIVETKAEEFGCGLTAEEQSIYDQSVVATEEALGGKVALDKYLLKLCVNRDTFFLINQIPTLYEKVQESQVDTTPYTDAELAAYI